MKDIQNQNDNRKIPLQKVGVKGLEYPIVVLDKKNKTQNTTCSADLFVNLPHHFKGTHMSRFIEIFHKYHKDLSMKQFLLMLEEVCTKLNAEKAFGTITFPFYLEKQAPVSKQKGMMCYQCTYEGEVSLREDSNFEKNFTVSVAVPVTTLCPCSKAISEFGAHNQRGIVKVKLQGSHFFWIEDIIQMIEESASCGVFSVLKRQDEKFVTEKAYENPRFVEDVVREVYTALKNAEAGFSWFSVEAENFESIHNHSAYAYTEYTKS
ncbi:MAG: GTP cyclohydrolase I FolE2 [Spirochaetaceae bacterium]|nr:GTP cyclohydrolase I FolE2 [Spirochaetaceae bacterium]